MLGPPLAAYAYLPAVVLLAWPVWGQTFWPWLLVYAARVPLALDRPLDAADLPHTGAAWARAELDRLGWIGIRVAALDEKPGDAAFYHEASGTIVLPPSAHQATAHAHATAAHELGHAVLHRGRPRLGALLRAARFHGSAATDAGVALLLGAALTATHALYAPALALIALGAVSAALVVVDEVMATGDGLARLRPALPPPAYRVARRHLAWALGTYVAQLVGVATALVAAPWILHAVDDLDLPAMVPAGGAAVLATAAAVACLAAVGLALTLWLAGWVPVLARVATGWSALLVALVAGHPAVPGWRVALAVIPAWPWLAIPGMLALHRLGSAFTTDDELAPVKPRPGLPVISRASLRRGDRPHPVGGALAVLHVAAAAPLALWYLLA